MFLINIYQKLIQLLKQNDYIDHIQRDNIWFVLIKPKLKYIYGPSTNKQLLLNINSYYNQLIRFFTRVCKAFSSKLNYAVDIIKKILLGIPVYKNSFNNYYSNYENQYSSKKIKISRISSKLTVKCLKFSRTKI